MQKSTKIFLTISGLITVLLLFYFKGYIINTNRPNVVFIVLDAARADRFSCYGYDKNTTANIDKIAGKGAIFLNNFTQSTFTYRSLAQIFFSRYYSMPVYRIHAMHDFKANSQVEYPWTIFKDFDQEQILLPEVFSQNQYQTAFFSEHPLLVSHSAYFSRKFDEVYYHDFNEFYGNDYAYQDKTEDMKIISSVVSWLKKNKDKKFFVYCHIMCPHLPYRVKKSDSALLSSYDLDLLETVRNKANSRDYDSIDGWTNEELEVLHALYDSNLEYADKWVGVLYDNLKQLELEKDTLVIISSDHGENLGDNNSGQYSRAHGGPPWDSVTHVPLIMSLPGKIPAGLKVKGLTESIDIMPSIIDICNLEFPKDKSTDGQSLVPYFNNPLKSRSHVFAHNSVRSERYKCILKSNNYDYVKEELLFDLQNDPEERHNIAHNNLKLKDKMIDTFEQKMNPYKLRYEKQEIKKTVDYPFCYLISSFAISPIESIEIRDEPNFYSFLNKRSDIKKSCVFNKYFFDQYLAYLPKKGPLPQLKLSAKIPNGEYQVSILIQTFRPGYTLEKLGLRYRFDQNKPFILPDKLVKAKDYTGSNNNDKNGITLSYYYAHLSNTNIEKENFSVEIKFDPQDKWMYRIYHLRFIPLKARNKMFDDILDQREIEKRLNSLKALGYAQ
jgi:arylsulfatase A-like enzyme